MINLSTLPSYHGQTSSFKVVDIVLGYVTERDGGTRAVPGSQQLADKRPSI